MTHEASMETFAGAYSRVTIYRVTCSCGFKAEHDNEQYAMRLWADHIPMRTLELELTDADLELLRKMEISV